MNNQELWINLPVSDLTRAKDFYKQIGFEVNLPYSDHEHGASFLIGKHKVVLMLFPETMFSGFTQHPISNTQSGTEVLFSIGADSKDAVDQLAKMVTDAGGSIFSEPSSVQDWMYGFGFCDPDGHRWNVLYMDMTKRPKNTPTAEPVFISVEVLVKGDMEKVWKCWNEPEHITQWYQASADWHAPRATNDLKVGGKFMTRMEAKDGSFGFDFEGTYTQVKLHEVISYILADRRTVDTLFKPQEDGIMITQTFMAETQNTPELQKFGWQSILNSFQSYVESLG